MPDGTWAVDPKESETARVAALVKENLEKQAKEKEEGSVVVDRVDRGIDALAMAFGKKDHSGFVKGLGGCGIGVGFAKAFGPSNRKGKRFEGCPYDELEVMKAKLAHDFEARFSERVAEEVQAYLAALIPNFTSVMMPSKNDLHVAYSNALSNQVNETSCPLYPRHFELEVATKCHLALNDEFYGNLVFVAEEKVQPCPNGVTHNNKMKSDHYRVSVDYIYSEYALLDLPVTTDDGISKLGEAKGYFVEWPKDLVVFEEKDHGSSLFDRHRSSLFMNHVID
ncbi:uncharacterized protein LOC110725886 [Chenopodium quinoa]|nr:uncharacterized protein LOC110725886 [Chenopodium quinoa]XP_021761046.1 uncharacterized protein LOC110725886 [Chenopodium quinoa]